MKIQERIEVFNRDNKPFYIVDHEDGKFSLCLPLDMLPEEYYPYCQEAFDAYAVETGVSTHTLSGRNRFGDGYDWQAAFCQAFAGDPNLVKISFDCEASGFFCGCDDLGILEQYGAKFREICTDTARFIPIVSQGIRSMEQQVAEQERLMKTVRGQLMGKPKAVFHIMTPDGPVTLHPADTKALLDGTRTTIDIEGTHYAAFEILEQEVVAFQTDLFNDNCIRMKTEEADLDMIAEHRPVKLEAGQMTDAPSNSPWGKLERCDQLCPGVYSVSTVCHGGIMVHESTAQEILSPAARVQGFRQLDFYCYEEDCDAPVAIRELMDKGLYQAPVNEYYKPGEYEMAINRSLQAYHPDYWKAREKLVMQSGGASTRSMKQADTDSPSESVMQVQSM